MFQLRSGAAGKSGGDGEGFVYVPGMRKNAVLLVAHADTAGGEDAEIELAETKRVIFNKCVFFFKMIYNLLNSLTAVCLNCITVSCLWIKCNGNYWTRFITS